MEQQRNSWPAALIAVTAMVCVTVLAVTKHASSDFLTLVTAVVVPTVTMLLVGGQISGHVQEVRTQVNGRLSEMIAGLVGVVEHLTGKPTTPTSPPEVPPVERTP
jgi:hypothetical protein